jgi:hypothetical protein
MTGPPTADTELCGTRARQHAARPLSSLTAAARDVVLVRVIPKVKWPASSQPESFTAVPSPTEVAGA